MAGPKSYDDGASCGSAVLGNIQKAVTTPREQENRKAAGEMKVFASGAKSTVEKPWYYLIPLIAMELIAERFAYGAKRHGERNYRKGVQDPAFVRDRINHLIEHTMKYAETRSREDLSAIGCNFAILADLGAFEGSQVQQTEDRRKQLLVQLDAVDHAERQIRRELMQLDAKENK